MTVMGLFYDGEISSGRKIALSIDRQGMLTTVPAVLEPQSIHEVEISSRIGNTPRRLRFPSGAMFETDDHEIIDTWLRQYHIRQGWAHALESKIKYVIGSVVFIAAFVIWAAVWGIPWASVHIANALPPEVNSYIGQGTLEALDKRFFKVSELSEERRSLLSGKFRRVLPDETQGINYTLVFRKGGLIGANAFALPDGTVIVTDELVELALDDEEIASVLLHEIGHVEHRHSLRQILNHSGLAALTLAVLGDINSAGALVLALPNFLLESSYTRELEWEADGYALEHMRRLGISTEHFANFMERLQEYELEYEPEDEEMDMAGECPPAEEEEQEDKDPTPGWFNYISSHPPTEERIARFRAPAATIEIETD